MSKRGVFLLSFVFFIGFTGIRAQADTFFGEFQTGLIEFEDFRYPVFLYVPENVKPGRRYPLVISIPDEGEEASDNIKKWTSIADRMTVLILTPTYKRLEDLPTQFDRWFFEVKSLATSVYPVNPKKVFLVGEEGGGAYASYLAVTYPEEFSGLAVLDGPLGGQFEKIMDLRTKPENQIPIFVAVHDQAKTVSEAELLAKIEKRALEFQESGYFIEIENYGDDVDFGKRDFKKSMISWLDEKSESWHQMSRESKKTWKEKFRRGWKDFFTV